MTGWRRAVASARRAMIVGCTSAALLLAAPFMWAWATHRAAAGQVLEVFLTPLGEGRVQVSVLYDFEVDVADGREHVLGWRLADTWCRPIDDPVVAIDAAIAYARLRPSGERGTRGRVFFRANDPAGSAFILPPDHPAVRRCLIGMILVLVSFVLSLPWGIRHT